jgi:hypothetical protein
MKAILSASDLEALAKKMDRLAEGLSDTEKALLLGVFGMAQSYLTSSVERAALSSPMRNPSDKPQTEDIRIGTASSGRALPTLSQGLIDAFKPGLPKPIGGVSGAADDTTEVSTGSACVSVGWSKD